jgi:hypothetical protein
MLGNDVPASIQTRCAGDGIDVSDLEQNAELKLLMDQKTFKPKLGLTNCPNPEFVLRHSDTTLNEGDPCQQDYQVMQRSWNLVSSSCHLQSIESFFVQNITRGGLPDSSGAVASPDFDAKNVVYNLSNDIAGGSVNTSMSDFIEGTGLVECGVCEMSYTAPKAFSCEHVGDNVVTVNITNGNGVSKSISVTATVRDVSPPTLITKSHTVYLNRYGWLNESDRVGVSDIDNGSWDNCGIMNMTLDRTPIYECGDEGPQYTTLTVTDVNGLTSSETQLVTVDDSARLGIGDDMVLMLPGTDTQGLEVAKMREDFGYRACKEFAVYVRREGEANFETLDEGWKGKGKGNWNIPDKYIATREDSRIFFEALCGLSPRTPPTPGTDCDGEVKARVYCQVRNDTNLETCYRARVSVQNPL